MIFCSQIWLELLTNSSFWLTILLLIVVVVGKDFYICGLERNFNFKAHQILQEIEVFGEREFTLVGGGDSSKLGEGVEMGGAQTSSTPTGSRISPLRI